MLNRPARAAALIVALAALLVSPAPSAAADPFEINTIFSVTGSSAFLGKTEVDTVNLIQDMVNRQGGVRGRPIKFVIHDDQSNPSLGVQLASQLIAQKVNAILGPGLTSVCNAVAPLVTDGPVAYCLSPGIHPPAGSYMFSGSISTLDSLVAIAAYSRDKNWKKVGIITSNDATGQDAERSINQAFASTPGEEITVAEHFALGDISVAAQMTHIKNSEAQAMIAWGVGTPIATVLRAISETGFDKPVILGGGNVTYAQMNAYKSFLPKEVYFPVVPSVAPDQLAEGPVERAIKAYIAAFKTVGIRPDIGQASPWDSAFLLIEAYKKLGFDATPAQIRAYLAGLKNYPGVDGMFDFTVYPQRGLGLTDVIIVRWDAAQNDWVGVSKYGGRVL